MIRPCFLTETAVRLLFFGGKGGVGKTTCAAAAALEIHRRRAGEAVLLVSTDPAHSLGDVLGEMPLPKGLKVLELDAAASLQAFKDRHGRTLQEIADRGTFLDEEDIRSLMDLSLPGMDELVAFLDISRWAEEERYGCIVVDTAPTGHTLRLLAMPMLIRRWVDALDALLAKHRYMRRRFIGDHDPDELDRFLLDLDGSLKDMETLLQDNGRCRFVPVVVPEALVLEETADLLSILRENGIPVQELVVNRLYPSSDCGTCTAERRRQQRQLSVLNRLGVEQSLGLPLFPNEPRREELRELWNRVLAVDAAETEPAASIILPPRVEHAPKPPPPDLGLLMFAGKGGVGKTTLACATALCLHAQYLDRRLLLFSANPAHSLDDALQTTVGTEPTTVMPSLDAQQIDPEEALGEIRDAYREELEAFLGQILPNLDLTFDREVMERLINLAPPGLDEIIALTVVLDHLRAGRYDLIVVDAAPSGHLIRLLELPGLINDWLKLFFRLLLKYRRVLRLPRLSERLVSLSRQIKSLRALLGDTRKAAVYAVTIPTELALAESADLLAAMGRLEVAVPHLFINQLTPPGPCSLCSALAAREQALIERYREVFPRRPTQVYRQAEPCGLDALARLGEALNAAQSERTR